MTLEDIKKLERILKPVRSVAETARLMAAKGPLVLCKPRIHRIDSHPPDHHELRVVLTVDRGRIGETPLRYSVVVRAYDVPTFARLRKIIAAARRKVLS